ncbi:hypothetical protein GP486_000327 [Trichoglossum hirsutum]|uniref:Peptidase S8/S53 domain-containing protein n=1 Tax=Trichoglossum hirsutum TaxID=265104 RepID=A0A9P8LI03_9PEZI|nr:hypothetical protein GP486_000327 [Trichoglossum hirsutum]
MTTSVDQSILFDGIQQGNSSQVEEYLNSPGSMATALQDLRNRQGYTPLAAAVINGNLRALEILHKFMEEGGEPIQPGTSEKDDLLCLAITNVRAGPGKGILDFVLAKWGIDLAFTCFDVSGQSALHFAASRDVTEVFKFLRKADLMRLKTELLKGRDLNVPNPLHLAALSGHPNVVNELLSIEPSLAEMQDSKGETSLHKAVEKGKKDIVEALLKKNPNLIRHCDNSGRSPYLCALKKKGRQSDLVPNSQPDLEPYLRERILRLPDLDPKEMRQLLFDKSQGNELFLDLDLKMFDQTSSGFLTYLDRLPKMPVEYEPWLRVVRLPSLQCDSPGSSGHYLRGHREACLIFEHLRKKNVERVFEVVVPDCRTHSHTNEDIVKCLQGLHVKRLDWRKKDLSVATIIEAAPDVEEISLLSSGNMDVLSHWASYEGLYRLSKLQHVDITISRDEANVEEPEDTCSAIQSRLESLIQHNHQVHLLYNLGSPSIEWDPSDCHCKPTRRFPHVHVNLEALPDIDEQNGSTRGIDSELIVVKEDIFTKMKPILDFLKTFPSARKTRKDCGYVIDHPIRIAIIDNGAAADLFTDITGHSFVESGVRSWGDSHWYIVCNTHGTQMAYLIDKMNKFRRLYVAKTHLGSSHQGLDSDAAVEAINWATGSIVDADIISMSWTLSPESARDSNTRGKVGEALSEAKKRLVFCATGDGGPTAPFAYPARFPFTIAISTTTIGGVDPPLAQSEHAGFSLPGEDLDVQVPTYLNPMGWEKTRGSSAATALAAGLASLILSCVRFAYYEEPLTNILRTPLNLRKGTMNPAAERAFKKFRDQDNMRRVFEDMCGSPDHRKKFVQPWTVFKPELSRMDFDEAKAWLRAYFDKVLQM